MQANTTDYEIKAEDYELYWQHLSSGMPMSSPTPYFCFIGAEDNLLRFKLQCSCRNYNADGGMERQEIEIFLDYQLPE